MIDYQKMPTGQLLQQFRDTAIAFGRHPLDANLIRQLDQMEEEISRRTAW